MRSEVQVAYRAVPRADRGPRRRPHVEFDGRAPARLIGEHGEDCRLGDEAGDKAQRRGREPASPPASLVELDRVDDGPGKLAGWAPSPI